jgi:hypothetical protein
MIFRKLGWPVKVQSPWEKFPMKDLSAEDKRTKGLLSGGRSFAAHISSLARHGEQGSLCLPLDINRNILPNYRDVSDWNSLLH